MNGTVLLSGIVLSLSLVTTGCAVNRATATIDSSSDLGSLKTLHVARFEKDARGIEVLLTDKLRSRGFTVTSGPDKPAAADAVVTYVDMWMWDITMYMIELTVTFRDPRNDYPLATGNSLHTSLTRKSPTEMVDEVIENILAQRK